MGDKNLQQLEQEFCAKYQDVIDGMSCGADVPPTDHHALFKAFQEMFGLESCTVK